MNTSKTRTGIGKKILSVMSAAIIGLSALGRIKATDTTASAAGTSNVYYDAGTFTVDDNHKIVGKVTSTVNGTYSLKDANVTDVLTPYETTPYETDESSVAFKGGETYIYVAEGTLSGNGITWKVYASPAKNTYTLKTDELTDTDEAKSAYKSFGKITELEWHNENNVNGKGSTASNEAWLTFTTIPYTSAADDEKAGVNIERKSNKADSVDETYSANLGKATQFDLFVFEGNLFPDKPRVIGLFSGNATAEFESDIKSSKKFEENGVDEQYKPKYALKKSFAESIYTTGEGNNRESEYPTFAIPYMIRESWLDVLPYLVDDADKGSKSVTGLRLDKMVARSECADNDTAAPLPKTYEYAENPPVFEGVKVKGARELYDSDDISFLANTDKDGKSLTDIRLRDGTVVYSEDKTNNYKWLDVDQDAALCKVPLSLAGLESEDNKAKELANTRIAMTTYVNATYSYSTDRPRLTGTFTSTTTEPGSPKIVSTLATNAAGSEGKTIALGKNVTFNDRVTISGLVKDTAYKLTAIVVDPTTGISYNDITPVTKPFTANSTTTIVDVPIKLDTTKYEGKNLVVFETLYASNGGPTLSAHEDKNDKGQTVTVASADDPTIPSNKSIATDKINETHTMTYSPNAVIKNKVPYTNLTIGKKYTVTSTTYDISTGKQVLSPVSKTFTADSTGYVEVEIPVNSVIYTGKTFSVLASISDGNAVVCSYDDMTDKDTQVMFPTVATVLTASNRTSKTVAAMNSVEVADLVRYTGLTPGRTYKVTGYILHKEQSPGSIDSPIITGAEGSAVANDIKIVASKIVEFTPMTSDGSVTVVFNVNAADLSGQHLVAIETIADGPTNVIVGEHKDINDANQTVAVKSGNNVYTGGNDMTVTFTIIAIVCGVSAIGFGTLMIIRKRRTNK